MLMEKRMSNLIFGFLLVLYPTVASFTHAPDTIYANQTLRYNETIVSPQETFELGFFSPGNSTNYYVGIWYKKISTGTVVWVANRNTPLMNATGELTLTLEGVLILRDATTGDVLWSSANASGTALMRHPVGQLLDTGNFIIYDNTNDQENRIWQSFDFLTDTLLPGMKLGWNLVTRTETRLTSWKSNDDPALGSFSYGLDIRGYPQMMLMNGPDVTFRGGPWNGLRFTGSPNLRQNTIYNFTFILNQREIYYTHNLVNASVFTRFKVETPSGRLDRLVWTDSKHDWGLYLARQSDQCDQYAMCGPFGICSIDNAPICECLKGFEPASPDNWRVTDWTQGCRHTIALECKPDEGFNKHTNIKLPDTRESWYNQTMTLVECEMKCKSNCLCTAYTQLNISGAGSGCLLWFGNLIDIRTFAENGDTLYIRMSASDLDSTENNKHSGVGKRRLKIIVPIAFVVLIILVSTCLFYRINRKNQLRQGAPVNERDSEKPSSDEDFELSQFGLSTLLEATNNFSMKNKLGEGGFGPVYKGILEDGKEIAVKRLAQSSTQGLQEFKNEVISISRLQHRNLVKLLGCCIEGAEKMLIYEYMPNKGLDSFLFDKTRSLLLDWPTRYHIITGIARGLLYLHQDSRLRIIHRDLKVSNILLDKDMNPKISDFGMARTFGGNQLEANTNRVVGTYGYMALEYAGDGIFSIKSDVYSFGVIVLEIVCGEKNRGFTHNEHCDNLVGYAWRFHNEGKSVQLVDKCLGESINLSQVLKSIHVGLLCVQRDPEDRPTMTSVILMLGSEGLLPLPKEPGFYVGRTKENTTQSSSSYGISSNNELSISILKGR